jgi:hypothetical protein
MLLLTLAVTAAAQTSPPNSISPEKKAMINEIRKLTGLTDLRAEQKVNASDVGQNLTRWADQQTGLTDTQMKELQSSAQEGSTRVEAQVRAFSSDATMMTALLEQATVELFDKSFTDDELKEMLAFYRTPTGQKAAKFSSKVVNDMMKATGRLFSEKFTTFANKQLDDEIEKLTVKRDQMKGVTKKP